MNRTILLFTLLLLSFACKKNEHKSNSISQKDISYSEKPDALVQKIHRLFQDEKSGEYFIRFKHTEPGFPMVYRFTPVLDKDNKAITDINHEKFVYVYGILTDGKYVIETGWGHENYQVNVSSMKSLTPGCYFEDSNYRITSKGVVEYLPHRGVTPCYDDRSYLSPSTFKEFEVLEVEDYDCCILEGKIYIDGCPLEKYSSLDTTSHNSIKKAIEEKNFIKRICFPG